MLKYRISRLLTSTQSASPLSLLLSISVGLLARIIGAARLTTISSWTVLCFSYATHSKMVALSIAAMTSLCWLAVLVCLCGPSSLPWDFVFCSLSPLQSLKTPLVVLPQHTTCIYLGTASRLSLVCASFKNSFKTESWVHNSALLQFRYPTLGPKLCHEYLFESFTDQLLSNRHVGSNWFSFGPSNARASAHMFKLFLLVSMVYVLSSH